MRTLLPPRTFAKRSETFARQFDEDWRKTGFSCVVAYDPNIDARAARMISDFQRFCSLPDGTKLNYHDPKNGGQRGYTPNGIEQSGKTKGRDTICQEWREHFMFGPYLPDDHPMVIECAPHFYMRTPHVVEVPGMVQNVQVLMDLQEELDLDVAEGLELVLGLKRGAIAGKLAYGDTSNRAHHYPSIPGKVLNFHRVGKVDAVDFEWQGKVYRNIVRADEHTDINWSTQLVRATIGGLGILTREGVIVGYTMDAPEQIVFNTGDYVELMVPDLNGRFKASPHWVGITPQTASLPRFSMTRFTHPRTTADVGGEREGVRLWTRLSEIGYAPSCVRDDMIRFVNSRKSDDQMVEALLKWEHDYNKGRPESEHLTRITRYYEPS